MRWGPDIVRAPSHVVTLTFMTPKTRRAATLAVLGLCVAVVVIAFIVR